MVRRIASVVFLLTLSGTHAAPLAGALVSTQVADCCANGMCPLHRNNASKKTKHEKMPGCDMDMRTDKSTPACQASPCSSQEKDAVGVSAYLLPISAQLVFAAVTTIFVMRAAQMNTSISQFPETPPPRS
ncbi:MAG: hypothetical protein WAM91_12205 [Candidatus Acidiferrales bacterium]